MHIKDKCKVLSALLTMLCKLRVILSSKHRAQSWLYWTGKGEMSKKKEEENKEKEREKQNSRGWREGQSKGDRNKLRMNNNKDVVAGPWGRGQRGRVLQCCVWSCPWLNNNQTCKNIYLLQTRTECGLNTRICSH